ncbi:hypothetical protein T492DRAFT_843620 [Pavlovales sp. CCMP2436]|nr:hypothetical protein T492DRAFT_843620 [Pavlovales sp. CCMP2436]
MSHLTYRPPSLPLARAPIPPAPTDKPLNPFAAALAAATAEGAAGGGAGGLSSLFAAIAANASADAQNNSYRPGGREDPLALLTALDDEDTRGGGYGRGGRGGRGGPERKWRGPGGRGGQEVKFLFMLNNC